MAFRIDDRGRRVSRSIERGLGDRGLVRAWQHPNPFTTTTEATTFRSHSERFLGTSEHLCVCNPLTPTKEMELASALFELDDSYRAIGQYLAEESVHRPLAASSVPTAGSVVVSDSRLGGILQLVHHRRDHDRFELILR
jgi:hypothetical protein